MFGLNRTRRLVVASATGLIVLLLLGGMALGLVEKTGFREGILLAFSLITTTGFGDGPSTWGGTVLSIVLFVLAAVHWFGILLAAFEIGLRRAGTPRSPTEVGGYLRHGGRWVSRRLDG